jgi:hypothetical protein
MLLFNNNGNKEIEAILKLKNKLKRNESAIDEKCKISEAIREEIREKDKQYMASVLPHLYVPLAEVIKVHGDASYEKFKPIHVGKLKDFDWQKSKAEVYICSIDNHLNICADCTQCDRHLPKCIGEKSVIIMLKD